MSTSLLELRGVHTHYGPLHVLQEVSLEVRQGEIVCLLGGNACGKSTTLRTALGLVRPSSGAVYLAGERVDHMSTAERVARGVAIVPENRRLFAGLSVEENRELGWPGHGTLVGPAFTTPCAVTRAGRALRVSIANMAVPLRTASSRGRCCSVGR